MSVGGGGPKSPVTVETKGGTATPVPVTTRGSTSRDIFVIGLGIESASLVVMTTTGTTRRVRNLVGAAARPLLADQALSQVGVVSGCGLFYS